MIIKRCRYGFLLLSLALLLNACPNMQDDTNTQGQQTEGEEEKQTETGEQEKSEEQKEEEKQEEQAKPDTSDIGTREQFWALNITSNRYYTLNAVLLAENAECLVYAECNASGKALIEAAAAEEIAREYSKNIEPQITGAFGEIAHMTPKKKVSFLLMDIKDGYSAATGGGYVAGYFTPEDMESGFSSNKRDMLYIDIDPGLTDIAALYCTIAHELQHLINYSNTILKGRSEQDLWINEGLSTAAEYVYGGDPANRVALYNADYGGTIQYGNNFFIWYGYWELISSYRDSLADYSTAYLFFQWLRIHAQNDAGIYKEILNSPYSDYRAVTQTARTRIPALGLTGSSAKDWETLLRTWMLSNAIQAPSGLLGYQDKIGEITRGKAAKLSTAYHTGTAKQEWEFFPGEGIFTEIDPADSPYVPPAGSGPHIRYMGFDRDGVYDLTPPYEGQFLLTFNANDDNAAIYPSGYVLMPGESGYLAGVLRAPAAQKTFGAMARASKAPAMPFSYPVDAGFLRERQRWEKNPAYSAGTVPLGEE
jgi:hypothetical protein